MRCQAINDLPNFLRKFIQKKVVKDFNKLTMFLGDGLMPKTSYECEIYFLKLFSKKMKIN